MERDNAKVAEKVFPENCGLYSASRLHFWILPTYLLPVTDLRYISCPIWFNFLSLLCDEYQTFQDDTKQIMPRPGSTNYRKAILFEKKILLRTIVTPARICVGSSRITIRRIPPREDKKKNFNMGIKFITIDTS